MQRRRPQSLATYTHILYYYYYYGIIIYIPCIRCAYIYTYLYNIVIIETEMINEQCPYCAVCVCCVERRRVELPPGGRGEKTGSLTTDGRVREKKKIIIKGIIQ